MKIINDNDKNTVILMKIIRIILDDLFNHEYDYKPNWTTRGSVTN